jgi:hypothetical protein
MIPTKRSIVIDSGGRLQPDARRRAGPIDDGERLQISIPRAMHRNGRCQDRRAAESTAVRRVAATNHHPLIHAADSQEAPSAPIRQRPSVEVGDGRVDPFTRGTAAIDDPRKQPTIVLCAIAVR